MISFLAKKSRLALIGLVLLYLLTHLFNLLELPVFADEAIYIRWSQLIIDDLPRYLFFSMNDGKTPLFFWILAPFQFLFDDQLYAARFVAVLIGLAQMITVMKITSLLTKNNKTVLFSGILVLILPFWYFHHRMALTDGPMVLLISLSMFFLIAECIRPIQKSFFQKQSVKNIFLAGVFFGLALLTKIPAVLFVPSLFLLIFLTPKKSGQAVVTSAVKVGVAIGIGIVLFGLFALVPSFSQLFTRGGDFLLPLSEVLAGKWKDTLASAPVYTGYFVSYVTPTLLLLLLSGLFAHKNKLLVHIFFWSGILFLLPIGILGKVVYARYLFPAMLPFTVACSLAVEDAFVWSKTFGKKLFWQLVASGVLVVLLANMISQSSYFIFTAITDHTQIPFVSSDVVQYLTEWSSGHGLYETSQLLKQESKYTTIAVATEGYFGSLPDGLNLYFHRRDVSNLAIDGVGYPVSGIPQTFAQTAQNFERKWLVVNSHRLNLDLDEKYLLREYCRPFNAPCLQVWDITEVFDSLVR